MRAHRRSFLALGGLLLLAACAGKPPPVLSPAPDEDTFNSHLRSLSSAEFAGRRPSTPGEERTVAYLLDQFHRLGLKPVNGREFVQPVALDELRLAGSSAVTLRSARGSMTLTPALDVSLWTRRSAASVDVANSAVVFVGYGVVAPEYGWDDYAGLDVRGKTVIILPRDPGFFADGRSLFRGDQQSGYGRAAYKFSEAARRGAAAALILHEEAAFGLPWEALQATADGRWLELSEAGESVDRLTVQGWIRGDAARRLLGFAGQDAASLLLAASRQGFLPRTLPISAELRGAVGVRHLASVNLAAMIPGSGRAREYVVYLAHWDHLGSGLEQGAEKVLPGAIDNASGVAALLTLAQSFTRSPAPQRSLVFLFTTAGEWEGQGSDWYVRHPLLPLRNTVAVIDIEQAHIGGPTRDVEVVGLGGSELDAVVRVSAILQGRELRGEVRPELGGFYESDAYPFARAGVPVMIARAGIDDSARGPAFGQAQREDYRRHRRHQFQDAWSADWDLRGTMQDLALYYELGARLAHDWRFPNWAPRSEFRAAREAQRPAEGREPGGTPQPSP